MMVRGEYPRPQQQRADWFGLNGQWEFCFDDEDKGIRQGYASGKVPFDRVIQVPFAYQYPLSGIGLEEVHEILWYKKTFRIDDVSKDYLLCFNGVDYIADVYVNGKHVCSHEGGYTAFEADISDYVQPGENVLVLRVYDPQWNDIPRGKQSWTGQRFGCWYLATSGIWKSVWIESFRKDYIRERTLYTDIDEGKIYGEVYTGYALADRLEITVCFRGEKKKHAIFDLERGKCKYTLSMIDENGRLKFELWSPELPLLYDVEYKIYEGDEVLDAFTSQFGMRKISIDQNGQICLNDCPYRQKLVLDQGYYGDGGLTAESAEQIRESIVLMKKMGFNGARKHQKIEDPYFYYYADQLGFLTWLEMPSAYDFTKREIQTLSGQLADVITQNSVFTSVVTYVPLNESWGVPAIFADKKQQALARMLYYEIKALDPTRLVCTNDGWENVSESDIVTIHDYCRGSDKYENFYRDEKTVDAIAPAGKKAICHGNHYHGQPLLFSEYGGIAYDSDSVGGSWGYGDGAKSEQELLQRIRDLTEGLHQTYFQGYCYTQINDVQQEVNGLCRYDMQSKFDVKELEEIFSRN